MGGGGHTTAGNGMPAMAKLHSAVRTRYSAGMRILCFFGFHKSSLASLTRKKTGGYSALCEVCACPLQREDDGPWRACEPLDRRGR